MNSDDRQKRFLLKLRQALLMIVSFIEDEYELRPRFTNCPDCGATVERRK